MSLFDCRCGDGSLIPSDYDICTYGVIMHVECDECGTTAEIYLGGNNVEYDDKEEE